MKGKLVVTLHGRVGQTPEVKSLANDNKLVSFGVAVNQWDGVKKEEVTKWYNVSVFGKNAEFLGNYLKKGDGIYVRGGLNITQKDEKTYVNIVAEDVDIISSSGPTQKTFNDNQGANEKANTGSKKVDPIDLDDEAPF